MAMSVYQLISLTTLVQLEYLNSCEIVFIHAPQKMNPTDFSTTAAMS